MTAENPFESPTPSAPVAIAKSMSDRCKIVANRYNAILQSVTVAVFCLLPAACSFAAGKYGIFLLAFVSLVYVGAILYGLFNYVWLALEVHGIRAAILYGLGVFIPCVSVICFFALMISAFLFLRKNGVKVGLFGVDVDSIELSSP